MLTLENLRVDAGAFALTADLVVAPQRHIAIVGPSGAGKSTLLDAIAGFRAISTGRILWHGQDITCDPPMSRPVGMLFQENNLFPHLDLVRNLGLALAPNGRRPDEAARARIDDALDNVGLAGMGARKPGQLSGGQQSRAALARVLLQARPILLLDEPFSALGPALKRDMLTLVKDVARSMEAIVLMITHDPEDARRFAEETILVADGAAHPPQDTASLFADPPPALSTYLGT